jgi:hypothetical protein
MPSSRHIPILILLGIGVSWFFTGAAALMILFTMVDAAFLGGVGHYETAGGVVSPGKFLLTGGPVLALGATLTATIAWGLHGRRRWSRYLVLAYWVLLAPFSLAGAKAVSEAAQGAVIIFLFAAFTWWYFFRKTSVLVYFGDVPQPASAAGASAVRSPGATLLALALSWLSIAGFGNAAIYVSGIHLSTMSPALAVAALFYGIAAAFAAFGLWFLKPWAPRAFLAWSACVLLTGVGFALSAPASLVLGGPWSMALFSCVAAILLALLYRYVRGVVRAA